MHPNRRHLAGAALALSGVFLLGACQNGGGGNDEKGFTQTVTGEDGSSSHVDMDNPEIPADFPISAVPLPEVGKLQAAVTGKQPPNRFYTFTYSLAGQNGRAIGAEYRRQLEKADFTIKNYSSSGGTDGGFTTFDATSPRWDVTVVSGKATRLEQPALSIQVTTHGTLSDDLEELDVLDNTPVIDPDDPNATTDTTIPAP
jgi:hypothetical protein